jgi:hypothetical protein
LPNCCLLKKCLYLGTEGRSIYLEDVGGGVGERGQRTAADEHLRLDRQLLVPHLDRRQLDPHHVDAVPEAAEEALAVVLEHAVEERAAEVAGGELLDVDELHPPVLRRRRRAAAVAAAVVMEERGADDAAAHAVVGGELLERRPPEVLLVVVVPLLRRRATERVVRLRLPERLRDRRPPAHAPPPARRRRRRHRRSRLRRRRHPR